MEEHRGSRKEGLDLFLDLLIIDPIAIGSDGC